MSSCPMSNIQNSVYCQNVIYFFRHKKWHFDSNSSCACVRYLLMWFRKEEKQEEVSGTFLRGFQRIVFWRQTLTPEVEQRFLISHLDYIWPHTKIINSSGYLLSNRNNSVNLISKFLQSSIEVQGMKRFYHYSVMFHSHKSYFQHFNLWFLFL